MAQKYKCNRCGNIFSANGRGDVRCPQCGAEDIVVVNDNKSVKKIIIAVLAVIVLAVAGFFIYNAITDSPVEGTKHPFVTEDVEFIEMDVNSPVTINPDSTSYSFGVYALLSESIDEPIRYSIKLDDGSTTTSDDGKFNDVPPSKSTEYIVRAYVVGRDDIAESSIAVGGFAPITTIPEEKAVDNSEPTTKPDDSNNPVAPRVTVQQVQQWVNNLQSEQSASMLVKTRGNNLVQHPLQWSFTNLKPGESKPLNAGAVLEKFDYEWNSLTVISITTNPANGMLTGLTCKINYREE